MDKRDLRAELLAAEQEARNKKRKAEGLPLEVEDTPAPVADDETNKRRKLLQDAIELDKDDDDDEEEQEDEKETERNKGQDDNEDENRCVPPRRILRGL